MGAHTIGSAIWFDCSVTEEAGSFLVRCDQLPVSDQGATLDEARRNLCVSLRVYLEACAELGILNRVLTERNIRHGALHAEGPDQTRIEVLFSAQPVALSGSNVVPTEKLMAVVPTLASFGPHGASAGH